MGAAAPKPPHAIHPHSKLWGILAFSHEPSFSFPLRMFLCLIDHKMIVRVHSPILRVAFIGEGEPD